MFKMDWSFAAKAAIVYELGQALVWAFKNAHRLDRRFFQRSEAPPALAEEIMVSTPTLGGRDPRQRRTHALLMPTAAIRAGATVTCVLSKARMPTPAVLGKATVTCG